MKFELRPMEDKDLAITFEWRNDPEVLKNAQTSNPISYNEHEAMFKWNNALKLIFEVDGEPAGYVASTRSTENLNTEWSFHMGKAHRGKGLSQIMLRAALYYLKYKVGYHCITSTVLDHNHKSIDLHIKLGFTEGELEGKFKTYYLHL